MEESEKYTGKEKMRCEDSERVQKEKIINVEASESGKVANEK